jgi:hypothetical protein
MLGGFLEDHLPFDGKIKETAKLTSGKRRKLLDNALADCVSVQPQPISKIWVVKLAAIKLDN